MLKQAGGKSVKSGQVCRKYLAKKVKIVSESLRNDSPGQLFGSLSTRIHLCEGIKVLEVDIQGYVVRDNGEDPLRVRGIRANMTTVNGEKVLD